MIKITRNSVKPSVIQSDKSNEIAIKIEKIALMKCYRKTGNPINKIFFVEIQIRGRKIQITKNQNFKMSYLKMNFITFSVSDCIKWAQTAYEEDATKKLKQLILDKYFERSICICVKNLFPENFQSRFEFY